MEKAFSGTKQVFHKPKIDFPWGSKKSRLSCSNARKISSKSKKEANMAAPYLYWKSYVFESPSIGSVNDVKSATLQKMQEIGLPNAAIHDWDVNGSTSDTIVAVCYVQLGVHKWTAIVMAAGTHAKSLRDQLIAKFDTIVWL